MLEKDGVGQRSGVRPVCGLLRSQKKLKVRCRTVSRSASVRAGRGGGPGAVAGVEQAKTIEPARAKIVPGRARSGLAMRLMPATCRGAPVESGAPRSDRLEGVLRAELRTTRVAHHAARLSVVRVRAGRTAEPRVVAAEIPEVEDVEEVHRQAEPGPADFGEVLAELEIDVAVGPGVRNDEAVLPGREAAVDIGGRAAESRGTAHIEDRAASERHQAAELDAEEVGEIHDPVRHDAVPLVVAPVVGGVRNRRRLASSASEGAGDVPRLSTPAMD